MGTAPANKCIDLDADETQIDSEGTEKDDTPEIKEPLTEVSECMANEVAKVCAAREAVRELKRRIEERKAQVDAAAQDETLQSMKAQVVEDRSNKKNREREKVVAEMTKC